MNKYLFLDFDGVLNTNSSLGKGVHLLPDKVLLVNDILKSTGAKLVISSTWRRIFTARELEVLLKVAGMRALGSPLSRSTLAVTPCFSESSYGRGLEIETWLRDFAITPYTYVILDDILQFMEYQLRHLILTDDKYGLQPDNVITAITILNGGEADVRVDKP